MQRVSLLVLWLVTGICGLGPTHCTRADAAFATALDTMSALDGWTRLEPTASAKADASGVAIVQAPSSLSGIVSGKGGWVPPFEIAFAASISGMIDTTGPDTGSVVGSFMLVDAKGEPDPEHAAAGCSELSFTFYGKKTMSAGLACCAKDCTVATFKSGSSSAESGEDQEYVGKFGDKQSMQIRDAPSVSDVNTWTVAVTESTITFRWKTVEHVMVRDGSSGIWPGGDLPDGLRPAFVMVLPAKDDKLATLLVPSVSIQGCSVGAIQPAAPLPSTQLAPTGLRATNAPPVTLISGSLTSNVILSSSSTVGTKKYVVVSQSPGVRAASPMARRDAISLTLILVWSSHPALLV